MGNLRTGRKIREHEVVIDLDNAKHEGDVHRWGGKTLLRIVIFEGKKRVVAYVSARKSGDIRAGRTDGLHLTLGVIKPRQDKVKHLHAKPWLVVCDKCGQAKAHCEHRKEK